MSQKAYEGEFIHVMVIRFFGGLFQFKKNAVKASAVIYRTGKWSKIINYNQ